MQNTLTSATITGLQAAVLRTIVYSDLFDYALTSGEVLYWLPVPATAAEVATAIESEPLASMLSDAAPYVTLRGREALVRLRERRRRSSAVLRRRAERYARLIARLPFVRMVAVTGSLAVDNADEGDDLDYLIVTASGRVWLTRGMIMAAGRLASLRGVTLCPNYLLAESALALPEHDFYTARELLQMRPITGHATYERMLAANAWWREHLPNAQPLPRAPSPPAERGSTPASAGVASPSAVTAPRPAGARGSGGEVSPLRRAAEALLRLPAFDALERWILSRKGTELRRQADSAEATFDETMCKGHFGAWRERTQRRLDERIREMHLKPQDESCSQRPAPGEHAS